MASKPGTPKEKLPKESSSEETPAKKPPKNPQDAVPWWNQNDKTRAVTGFFLAIAGIYLLIAIVSYFLTWESDFDKISGASFFDIASGSTAFHNLTGSLGAALSHFLVYRGFGISSLAIPFLLFISGVRLAFRIRLLPLRKSTRFSFYLLIWLSISLGLVFQNTDSVSELLGGTFGRQMARWMIAVAGETGLALALLFLLVAFTSINLNFPLSLIQRILRKKEEQKAEEAIRKSSGTLVPKEERGVYNLEEYAVQEDAPASFTAPPTSATPVSKTHVAREVPLTSDKSQGGDEEDVEFVLVHKEPKPKEAVAPTSDSDIELTIETVQPPHAPINNPHPGKAHYPIDTPFDPTLDLPHYKFPLPELLHTHDDGNASVQMEELDANKKKIVETLKNYQIEIQKIKATIGPTVTLYEIVPAPGIRISKIKNLEDDIALSLAALGIRIIAPIPGKGTIGIEVPNQNPETVAMRTLITSEKFLTSKYELPIAIGKTIANESYVADLTRMPHLLIAGATGQGKSVGLNAIITSLLYKKHPSQLKFVLVDPKKVELSLFSKIERHFLAKLPDLEEAIITDIRQVVRTLNSLVIEMEDRYILLKMAQVKTIKEYNTKFIARKLNPAEGHHYLPYIVLVVDEFADLIMTAGKEVELAITRLAQLARAIGIHLIIATQRPSVNIITGTSKANFPARIAFKVTSKIDSRTILDTGGADQLIGRGDMLLSTGSDLMRLQCAFIDTPEIETLCEFIGSQRGYPETFALPEYYEEGQDKIEDIEPGERDELFEDAARIVVIHQQGSTSLLQRKLKLGYNRAGRLIDQLEAAGIVGPFEGSKAREVRVANEFALEQFLKDLNGN